MALRGFAINEMLAVSVVWLKDGTPANKALSASEELAPLLPLIRDAVLGIHASRPTGKIPRLAQIKAEQAAVDAVHNKFLRGVYGVLTNAALVASVDSPKESKELISLRDTLLPVGLEGAQATYSSKAGAALLLSATLTDAAVALLKAIPLLNKSVYDFVLRWMEAGKRLGRLETEKVTLPEKNVVRKAAQQAARYEWIRVVNALTTMAALAHLDAETQLVIFGEIRDLESKRKPTRKSSKVRAGAVVAGASVASKGKLAPKAPKPKKKTRQFGASADRPGLLVA